MPFTASLHGSLNLASQLLALKKEVRALLVCFHIDINAASSFKREQSCHKSNFQILKTKVCNIFILRLEEKFPSPKQRNYFQFVKL